MMSTSKTKQKLSERYSSDMKNNGGSGKSVISRPLLIGICSIIVVIISVVVIILLEGKGKESNNASMYNMVVSSEGSGEQSNKDSDEVPEAYDVSMNSTWTFPDAKSASTDAYVANIETNTNTVYFVVKRNDTNEDIYTSPDLSVGSHITNIKLEDETLPKGSTPCTVTYYLLGKDRKKLSHVNVNINIIIEN